MEVHDKGYIGNSVESKEGERGPLSCNKANLRAPSLDENSYKFSEETIARLNALGDVLLSIRRRLDAEGINIYED